MVCRRAEKIVDCVNERASCVRQILFTGVMHCGPLFPALLTYLDTGCPSIWLAGNGPRNEELVAELEATFLCADLGITPEIREDHAAYLGHWRSVLKEDKRAIFSAAAQKPKAKD